ncbi:MAG: hypothetical protein C0623_04260 [Desulfuromonas sp.]|nr:MAG: hypothetical protein C0623_04260 [Desulfuromonas sp.]
MGPDKIQALVQEDRKLHVGDTVVAHWNNNGYYFHSRGKVTRLTTRKVQVRLLETPGNAEKTRKGEVIELPRITDFERWSSQTCVRRLGSR